MALIRHLVPILGAKLLSEPGPVFVLRLRSEFRRGLRIMFTSVFVVMATIRVVTMLTVIISAIIVVVLVLAQTSALMLMFALTLTFT